MNSVVEKVDNYLKMEKPSLHKQLITNSVTNGTIVNISYEQVNIQDFVQVLSMYYGASSFQSILESTLYYLTT